jgi:hypothetical protein
MIAYLAAGCGGTNVASPPSLDGPVRFAVAAPASGSARAHLDGLTAMPAPTTGIGSVPLARATPTSDVALPATTASLALHTRDDGSAVADALQFALADVRIFGEALPADGWLLRDVVLRGEASTHLRITRATPASLVLDGEALFALTSKLMLDDGSLYPLGAIPVGPATLHVEIVESADGSATIAFAANCAGECGGVDGLARLSDGALSVSSSVATLAW